MLTRSLTQTTPVAAVQGTFVLHLQRNLALQDLPFVALPTVKATPAATTAALICCSRRKGPLGRCLPLRCLLRRPCICEGLSGSDSLSVDDVSDAVSDSEVTEPAEAGGGFTGWDIPYACESSANCMSRPHVSMSSS